MRKLTNILLGIWLVLNGLVFLGGIRFSASGTILAVLGAVTGILFLLTDQSEKLWTRIGSILLGLWLVTNGLLAVFHIHFSGSGVVLAVLAVAAGVLVLLRP
jgi:hypothetical protein